MRRSGVTATAIAGLCLMLGACMATPEAADTPDHCGAAAQQGLVGGPVAAFDAARAAGPVRILPPGSAATMDFRPDRLNIETDAAGAIRRITCG